MPKANMPPPAGGKLTCPVGTDPWVKVDNSTGEINAECKPFTPTDNPNAYRDWILTSIDPRDRPRRRPDGDEQLKHAIYKGFYVGVIYTYYFAKFDERDDGAPQSMTAAY
ncbi:MAG: hypothetical protein ABJN69_06400 [Hellea sp.]